MDLSHNATRPLKNGTFCLPPSAGGGRQKLPFFKGLAADQHFNCQVRIKKKKNWIESDELNGYDNYPIFGISVHLIAHERASGSLSRHTMPLF